MPACDSRAWNASRCTRSFFFFLLWIGAAHTAAAQHGKIPASVTPQVRQATAVPPVATAVPPIVEPPGAASSDLKAQITALNKVTTEGRAALQETAETTQTADTLQKTLSNEAAPPIGESRAAQIAALSGLTAELIQVAAVQASLTKAQADDASLTLADVALKLAVNDPAVQAASDTGVANARTAAQAAQSDVEERLQQLKSLQGSDSGSFSAAITADTTQVGRIASGMDAEAKANPTSDSSTASSRISASTDPVVIRQALSQGLPSLARLLTDQAAFQAAWGGLKPAFAGAGADATVLTSIDSSLAAVTADHAAPATFIKWFPYLTGAASGDDLTALSDKYQKISDAIQKGDRQSAAVQDGNNALAQAQAEAMELTAITQAWPELVSAWTTADATVTGTLSSATNALSAQAPIIMSFMNKTADLSDLLAGDAKNFVSDQVNLFYFTDVQRIMGALNARTHLITEGRGDEQSQADQARKDLLAAEGAVARNITAVNEAKSQLRTIQEDIRQANASAADAANQAATAHVLYQNLLNQQTKLRSQLPPTTADSSQTAATATILDDQVSSAKAASDAADAGKAATQQAVSGLQLQATVLPQQLLNAQATLSAARAALDEQRTLAASMADQEVQAFAKARDNSPYYQAPASFLSTNPAARVEMFAYPDSKTIFIRGLGQDVRDVEDMIAEFDRPAPQARITLWSLQFNGSDTANLTDIVQKVDLHLLLTRTLIGFVQDRLRDALGFVVNHVAADAQARLDFLPSDDSQGRLLRYQFYQPEVLTRLGYDLQQPPSPVSLAQYQVQGGLNQLRSDLTSRLPDPAALEEDADQISTATITLGRLLEPSNAALEDLVKAATALKSAAAGPTFSGAAMRALRLQGDMMQAALTSLTASVTALHAATAPTSTLSLPELAVDDASVTRYTLPDPASDTTLGQMLFVLSLGRQAYREAVLTHFLLSLESIPVVLPGFKPNDPTMAEQRDRLGSFTRGLRRTIASSIADAMGSPDSPLPTDLQTLLGNEKVRELQARMIMSNTDMNKLLKSLGQISGSASLDEQHTDQFYPRFPSMILGAFSDFGSDPSPPLSNYEPMSANQNEILLAVQAGARDNVANTVKDILRHINNLVVPDRPDTPAAAHLAFTLRNTSPLAHQYRMQMLPLLGWLYTKFYQTTSTVGEQPASWLQHGLVAVGALPKSTLAAPLGLDACEKQLTAIEQGSLIADGQSNITAKSALDIDKGAWLIASLTGQHNSLGRATPREAAADDMIKRLIISVEDDLDYFFVQPELEAIRKEAVRPGVEFGSIQREGLLVTNRRVGRVDPRANADPELSGGTDFLSEASQLGQLYDRFRQEQAADKITSSGAAAAGGLANLLGSPLGTAAGIGAVASLFGDMLTTPQPIGEIYSINSGNLFKVTPVFDPSGQALRFQFDYTGLTDVREPDGTTNASIPRIERHTVDDDVQLTNLELREVSRFEANNAIGTPERRTGGLPLLKELPLLRDIPLIGYYTRTAKKAATRQESLIFAQTSMYPTVADIVNLLVDIPPLPVADRGTPPYLAPDPEVGR